MRDDSSQATIAATMCRACSGVTGSGPSLSMQATKRSYSVVMGSPRSRGTSSHWLLGARRRWPWPPVSSGGGAGTVRYSWRRSSTRSMASVQDSSTTPPDCSTPAPGWSRNPVWAMVQGTPLASCR